MLTSCPVYTTIPVADMDRAKRWYQDKLGFKAANSMPSGALFDAASGTHFLLYPTPNAGKAPQTIMAFETKDLDSEVRDLKTKGVAFEEYDMPGLKTRNSIADMGDSRAAWFKDCEGNILGVVQMAA